MSATDEFEIHRYLDGEMTARDCEAFERRLALEPALLEEVTQIQHQNAALRRAVPEPSADNMARLFDHAERAAGGARTAAGWQRLAAAIALLALGFGGGFAIGGRGATEAGRAGSPEMVLRTASAAHRLYSVEVVHPVEVSAEAQDHLKGWLSNRLGTEISIPDLEGQNLALVGGRLLPFDQGAAAQFMYEDAQGARVTLYLTPAQQAAKTSLKYGENEGDTAAYWQDGAWHYALVGPFDRDKMTHLAQTVQGALF